MVPDKGARNPPHHSRSLAFQCTCRFKGHSKIIRKGTNALDATHVHKLTERKRQNGLTVREQYILTILLVDGGWRYRARNAVTADNIPLKAY